MAISPLLRPFSKTIATLCLLTLVTACGGGGGSKDTTPNAFSFPAVTGAAPSAEVTSAPITVAGINKETPISVSAGSKYSIDGAAPTAAAGTVQSGQVVTVITAAAAASDTATTATLSIGGVSGNFKVSTIDTIPAAITMAGASDVAFASVNTSAPVTITGIDTSVPISISAGGEYKINNGSFTSAPGTVSPNDVLTFRATAASTYNTPALATVTIGGITTTYTVTTVKDTVPPLATVIFPTPVSMTKAPTIKVRGTASDAGTGVVSVMVAGTAAVSTDGFATWVAEVPLVQNTTNLLTVVTTDGGGNTKTDQVSVKRFNVFSRIDNQLQDDAPPMEYPHAIALDLERNRLLVGGLLDSGAQLNGEIFAIDLATSIKTPFFSLPAVINNYFTAWNSIFIDDINQKIILRSFRDQYYYLDFQGGIASGAATLKATASAYTRQVAFDLLSNKAFMTFDNSTAEGAPLIDNAIHALDLETGIESTVSDNNVSPTLPLTDVYGLAINAENNKGWVVNRATNSVVEINLVGGERTILSPAQQEIDFSESRVIQLDAVNDRLLILVDGALYAVDLTTGARSVISDRKMPSFLFVNTIYQVALDSAHDRLFVPNSDADSVFVIDLITGDRAIIGK